MPRILITGNGFDLHHKLPTTYKDFIKIVHYISENSDYSFDQIYSNSDFYEIIKVNFNSKIEFPTENLKLINEISNKNLLYNFFREELEIDTWIDFEHKIEFLLKNIYFGIKILRKNIIANGLSNHTKAFSIVENMDNNIVSANILDYLGIIKIQNRAFWLEEQFLMEKYRYIVDIAEDKIIQLIYSQLIEFRKLFNLYLQTFVIPLYENYKSRDFNSTIFNNINYYFTFNYTPTFEKLYNKNTVEVNYLHGKSQENSENIVFGISALFSSEEMNKEYLKFTKYYQKFNNNTDYHFLNLLDKDYLEAYIFYFWGHSLDASDSNYINEVFEFITENKNMESSIVIIYHSESSRSKCLLNLFSIRGRDDIEHKIRSNKLKFYSIDSSDLIYNMSTSIEYQPFF